jgi:hypothetical protein
MGNASSAYRDRSSSSIIHDLVQPMGIEGGMPEIPWNMILLEAGSLSTSSLRSYELNRQGERNEVNPCVATAADERCQ